jgi:hypothetical protein
MRVTRYWGDKVLPVAAYKQARVFHIGDTYANTVVADGNDDGGLAEKRLGQTRNYFTGGAFKLGLVKLIKRYAVQVFNVGVKVAVAVFRKRFGLPGFAVFLFQPALSATVAITPSSIFLRGNFGGVFGRVGKHFRHGLNAHAAVVFADGLFLWISPRSLAPVFSRLGGL